jgi:type I restriction enzyme M protein
VLTDEDIEKIAGTVHAWRGDSEVSDVYGDVAGFCYSAKLEEIEKNGFVLTPGRYVGTPEKDSRPIGAEFVRLLRVNQAGKRRDIKWARSQKAGLQMTAGALIADQAIRKL